MKPVPDLAREQAATLARPPRKYGWPARMLFAGMDLLYGREMSLKKMRILEILARIPYQAWEIHHYRRLNRAYADAGAVARAEAVIRWGREAQDNEFWHLQVVLEKIRRDQVRISWLQAVLMPYVAALKYNLVSRLLAFFSIRTAFELNADFEDHAEHEYMRFVQDHPELEQQPVTEGIAGEFKTWADVFRRIGLDEREHMNNSLVHAGRPGETVPYADGTPA